MTAINGGTAEEFARALGVTVREEEHCSDAECGPCFGWDMETRTAVVCVDLCGRKREHGFRKLLSQVWG